MTATTITLRLEPQPPNALTEDELDALTRALARQLDAPELTAAVGLPDPAGAVGAGAKGLGRTLGTLVLEVVPKAVPALVDFLKAWVTRESRVTIKVQRGADLIEVAFDPRTINEAQVEIMTRRLLKLVGG
ncbi:hypothetical protein [uncultured Thiodictyon sp.]|jgi:hypothetical protein|uniref:hypothetical protein n=1 Tax=uncultured Thiodictyon sp. TaxID=1846217 RepID=UPI0025F33C09|nr:hypothetical protein [uncultured Thiodictyon sp.]